MANTTIYPYGTDGELPSSVGIVNDLITGGSDKALSAEMGKTLGITLSELIEQSEDMVHNMQLLTEQLADSAFIGDRPDLADVTEPISDTVSVTYNLSDATSANTKEYAIAGNSYRTVINNDVGYVLDTVTVTMGGIDITEDCYNAKTREVSIEEATGNIVISNTSSVNSNPNYVHLYINESSTTAGHYSVYYQANNLVTQTCPITPGYSKSITFKNGYTSLRKGSLILTDANGDFLSYYLDNASPRTVTVGERFAGLRLNCSLPNVGNSFITNDTDGVILWDGTAYNPNDTLHWKRYFDRFLNSRGDWVNVKYQAGSQGLVHNNYTSGDSTDGYITSKDIELPTTGNKTIKFSVGTIDTDCRLYYWNADWGDNSYLSANAVDRSELIAKKFKYARLTTKAEYYANSYVECDGVRLWEGGSEEQTSNSSE